MTDDERIAHLEAQLDKLNAKQTELFKQLAQAERDQWQGRIEDLKVQFHLSATEGHDRAHELMDQLDGRWAEACAQFDNAAATATDAGATLRDGLESAVREVRQALLQSKSKIAS